MIGDMFFPDIKREKRACDDDDISRDGKILTRSPHLGQRWTPRAY